MYDFLIVGQGIAGSAMALQLLRRNQKVCIVDRGLKQSASMAASGLINPVTGRTFVKAWQALHLQDYALKFYRDLEQELDLQLVQEMPLWRTLHTAADENRWMTRMGDPEYANLLGDPISNGPFAEHLVSPLQVAPVLSVLVINLRALLKHLRSRWIETGLLTHMDFDPFDINWSDDHLSYRGIEAKQLILCTGYDQSTLDLFEGLPLRPYTGQSGLFSRNNWPQAILKNKEFVVPVNGDQIWFGARNSHDLPTPKSISSARKYLASRFYDMCHKDSKAIEYHVGVRPTVRDRRPLLGTHQKLTNLHLFNGLGTKGASLAPLLSQWMAEHLLDGSPLPAEINMTRFSGGT